MKRPMMCTNPECERFRERVSVLGGCAECTQPLALWEPAPPSDDQLMAHLDSMGLWSVSNAFRVAQRFEDEGLAARMREVAQDFHKLVQRTLDGDRDASRRLAMILEALGRDL